ncbi:cytochrome c biogenesis protein CcsA [Flavobacteriaceae bacterium]|nr:cytochrome c biogenesis protein CcsA [Flavobacteriaceae bacterium]MDC1180112.1 cytochrome c biogenesis protein CcsA [Flavobacteriaceae bacterium]
MIKKIFNLLFSTRLTGILFIVFAIAMAVGTFLDAGQDTSPTPYSRTLIFNALWFELIMLFFIINFTGNIFKYKLLSLKKWPVLLLHFSWIFIILGAFITRYFGYEGIMSIREGQTENTFISEKTYIQLYVDGDYLIDGIPQRKKIEESVDFSTRLNNKFKTNLVYGEQDINIELVEFIAGAEKDIIPNSSGEEYLKIVEAGDGVPHNHFLKVGEVQSLHNVLYALNKPTKGAVNITYTDNAELFIESPFEGEYMIMASGTNGILEKNKKQVLNLRSRYLIGNQAIVFPKNVVRGVFDIVQKSEILKSDEDGIALKISTPNEVKTIKMLGGKGINSPFEEFVIGGLNFNIRYGAKVYDLPFSIKLNDFIADKYPGSENSYSSFASEVTVIDEKPFDFRIFMNNILNHQGYRFFQASFDPDEQGTILSVNKDALGTFVTYLGYILLYIGLMAIMFARFTRFDFLRNQILKVKKQKQKLTTVLLLLTSLNLFSQTNESHLHVKTEVEIIDSILRKNIVPKDEALKFGNIVIQDISGRMMPVNTFASEFLRKLSKKDYYSEFDANQIFLSIQESPLLWYNIPVIYLKMKKGDSIRSIIGVDKSKKHVSLVDFFTERGEYKLAPYLEDAYKAQVPTGYQKEFKETDQRVNLLYNMIEGNSLKLFPIPNDDNNKWTTPKENIENPSLVKDSLYSNFINTGFKTYLYMLNEDKIMNEFSQSSNILQGILSAQYKFGGDVMLSPEKIEAEVLYNKYDIFKKLFSWYLYAGTFLFIVLIIQIFKNNRLINISINVFKVAIIFLFVLHTLSLIWRWYISGHAPWSDAYESMIYVAWATMFFGLAFGRKSDLTLASTTFIVSMILMIAHWSWMDPAIANLQPVLDSYWLMIHVAVIVGSYGPFALSMILGFVSLFLMILTNSSNRQIMKLNIKELTLINEMSLTVGLVMLTIGNFLGGMWANESWGRYWGWDPKETWALISIMVYAFVLHMRLIPGLKSRFVYSIASILSFASILMTYFGVNFYLAGLHSYAKDDQQISFLYSGITLLVVVIMGVLAYPKYKKYLKN